VVTIQVTIVKAKLLLIISTLDGKPSLKFSFMISKSGFKSFSLIFIPSFKVNNINNPIEQAIICEIRVIIQAQLAHIAGKGQCPATKIGARQKFIKSDNNAM
jgi:hypothetical protein